MKRVIGDVSECFICGSYGQLERHHIMGGANRRNSEKDGLCVMLCHNCHNEPPNGVHFNPANNMWLKRTAQRYAEQELKMTREQWMQRYGKNYLDESGLDIWPEEGECYG